MRTGGRPSAIFLSILLLSIFVGGGAAEAVDVPGTSVIFRWSRAAGPVESYAIYVSRNGGPFVLSHAVQGVRFQLRGRVGDLLRIQVAAVSQKGSTYTRGPLSPASVPVRLVAAPSPTPKPTPKPEPKPTPTPPPSDGTGGSGPGDTAPPLYGPAAAVADFDGDGQADVAFHDPQTREVVVALLEEGRPSRGGALASTGGAEEIVGAADLNGDGRHDLLLRDANRGDVTVWLLDGASLTGGSTLGRASVRWTFLGAGQVDGSGGADLFWYDPREGVVLAWRLRRLERQSTVELGRFDPSVWAARLAEDLDGDGYAEVVLRNLKDGDVRIWEVRGSEVVRRRTPRSAHPRDWALSGAADLNGDGEKDLLLRNATTGELHGWVLRGLEWRHSFKVGWHAPEWRLETGDADGDGRADLFWMLGNRIQLGLR